MGLINQALEFNATIQGNLTKYEQIQYVATQPYFVTVMLTIVLVYIIVNLFNGATHLSARPNSKILFESWVFWRTALIPLMFGIITYLILFYTSWISIPLNFFGG